MPAGPHSHIYPRGCLRAWVHDGRVAMRLLGEPESRLISVADAAVRTGFYRERSADGRTNDWLEEGLGRVENRLVPIVRDMEARWPLSTEDRGRVAEFLAVQTLRTPGWRAFHSDAVRVSRDQLPARYAHLPESTFAHAEAHLRTDRERHMRMIEQIPMVGTMLANMHWTLLRSNSPRLATSDHPVVVIGRGPGDRHEPIPRTGLINCAEIRFAVSPWHLLVASWVDQVDGQAPRETPTHWIRNHNSAVIAQAEKQWFHRPGQHISAGGGQWIPISFELHSGYDPGRSQRRQHVSSMIERLLEAEPPQRDVIVAGWRRVHRPAA